jgi:hypothetical protein
MSIHSEAPEGAVPLARRRRRHATRAALLALACCAGGLSWASVGESRPATSAFVSALSPQQAAQLREDDRGLYVAHCPAGEEPAALSAARPRARSAEASHAGWPPEECLKMDKGPAGANHTIVGLAHVHNWLLGGYGNDTIFAGDEGDVIWGDYQPEGQPEDQRDYIHGGAGDDWIYSSHGYNEIWTGAGNDHLALVYGHGVVFCNGGGLKTFVMRYLPQNRPWRLVGCNHKVIDRYRA